MGYKVLLITPISSRAELIKNTLHSLGQEYTVLHVHNHADGIALTLRETPDLILFDWLLERRLAGSFSNIKLAVSGLQTPMIAIAPASALSEIYHSGATDYVDLELNPIELSFRVKSALTMHKLHIGVLEQNRALEEQSAILIDEKQKVEDLLLNILPYEVAEQLKNKGKVQPKQYRMVSIMFTDFVGFTRISEMTPPAEIMSSLDHFFGVYDEITGKHYLEKLKTIGDAYMCAGGLPLRNKSNPIDTVLAALEIQYYMKEYNRSLDLAGLPLWELRVGIHTGRVVAGVIGKKKFAYDIWGDTVNTAARMETASEACRVNVSGTTYEYIKDFFDCTYRGKVKAKNKGEIDMYFVNCIKKEYAADPDCVFPNNLFMELLTAI